MAEGLGNVSTVDISDVLDNIGEAAVKTAIRESTKNIFAMSAQRYIWSICEWVDKEVKKRGVTLSEAQLRYILDLIEKSEQEAVKWVMESLPDNPFVREFAAGIQVALEESLKKETESCTDRLRQ